MWSSTQHLLWDISSHRPIFDQHLIPQTDFWPATYTTASPFSIQEGVAKKQWKLCGFDYFTGIFTHDFYNSRAVNSDNCNSGISYPTNWFLTRHSHHRTPPRCSIQQGAAKNLELVVFFWVFYFDFYSPFWKFTYCHPGNLWLRITHPKDQFWPAAHTVPFWWHQKVAALQQESQECVKEWVIYFFHSPFFAILLTWLSSTHDRLALLHDCFMQ